MLEQKFQRIQSQYGSKFYQIMNTMNTTEPIIVKCNIGPYPKPMPEGMFDPMPRVKVQFNNGEEKVLFEYYPDEISFEESEFIGLTEESARRLKFEKDKKFILK